MVKDDTVTFWRQLDELRDIALAGDQGRANQLIAELSRTCHQGDERINQTRRGMLALIAERLALDPGAIAAAPPAARAATPAPPVPVLDGDLGGIQETGRPGISLVSCCMNREQNLLRALESWIACAELDEIVIVDWSSDRPVREALDEHGVHDPRIRIVRVEGESRWILSYAFNAGFRVAAYDRILKTDADIVLEPDFFTRNELQPGRFIAGNWRTAEEGQSHVNGFFFVHKKDLAGIAGFNEHITTYGWDDDDLYDRLERFGVTRSDVAPGSIYHLPHSDEERTGETGVAAAVRPGARAELTGNTMYKIRTNRLIAHIMPYWDRNKMLLPFRIGQDARGDTVLRRKSWKPHPVPAQVKADAEYYALLELASWRLGLRTLGLDREGLDRLLVRPLADLGALDVEIALGGHPEALRADGGYLVVALGPEGIADTAGAQRAFETLTALAERVGMALVLSGPFTELPGPAPARARDCAVVADWHKQGTLTPVDVDTLRMLTAPDERRFLRIVWSEETIAALDALSGQALAAPALAASRPRVFADGQHGLGNRMRAIASAAAIAAQSDRELVVVWQPDDHCDCRMEDLFDYDGAVIEESFAAEAESRGCRLYNYMEVEAGAQKDAPIDPGSGDLYLRSAYVFNSPLTSWSAENAFLRALTPVEAVRDMVAGVRHPNDVSAHVRMAGGAEYEHLPYEALENWTEEGHKAIAFWREKSHFSHFLTRLDALSAEGRAERIFLAADAPETYDAFRRVYGERLAMLERAVYDRSAQQLRYALADAILLGRAPLLLGSTWSSFSELAMRMSPQDMTVEMSGKDF